MADPGDANATLFQRAAKARMVGWFSATKPNAGRRGYDAASGLKR